MLTNQTIDLMRSALAKIDDALTKTVSTATGLVAYDLQAPAKNLYPVNTPLRNRIPRVGGGTGVATNWKVVQRIIGSGFDSIGWVAEGQRSARMQIEVVNRAANYCTLGEEDAVTFEAINAAVGFEDVLATSTMRVLQKMMMKEEMAILGGNSSLALGVGGTPTLSAAGSGGTLPAGTYSVIAVPLSLEGFNNSTVTNGVATSRVITGADGLSYTVTGGSGMKSAAAAQAVTLGQNLSATTAAVPGAMGYAWYVGIGAGNEVLQTVTGTNSASFSKPLTAGTQNATAVTADNSLNTALGFDGLITTALKAGPYGATVISMGTGVAGVGSALTPSGRGTVEEIDDLLLQMWNKYQVSPTVFWVNAQQYKDIATACLSGATGPLLSYMVQTDNANPYSLVAGGTVAFYFNPFAMGGGIKIPIMLHPNMPAGTILAHCENLPVQYQSNHVPNTAEMKVRQEYYQLQWPLRTRQREFGVYCEEVLAVYAPLALGVITNIAPSV